MISFIAGVASSMAAVGILAACTLVWRRLDHRKLQFAVGFGSGSTAVVSPAFLASIQGTRPGLGETQDAVRVVRDKDVQAVTTATEICRTLGLDAGIIVTKAGGAELPENLFCIAGWSGNDVSTYYIDRYCPGFEIIGRDKEETDYDNIYYRCGLREFRDSDQIVYGYIFKFSKKLPGNNKNVLVTWGHHGEGNRAAVEFIRQHYRQLAALKRDSYCVAIRTRRDFGHTFVDGTLMDLTDDALRTPQRMAASSP